MMRFQPSHLSHAGYGAVDAPMGTTPSWAQLADYPKLERGDADADNKASSTGKYLAPAAGRKSYKGFVRELQRLLVKDGLSVSQDGYFGEETEKAVVALNNKVRDNGTYDFQAIQPERVVRETWAYLYNRLPEKEAAPASASASTSTASSGTAATTAAGGDKKADTGKSGEGDKKGGRKYTGEKIEARKAARIAKEESREMWKKIALWGGVAVVGVGALTLIVKSLGKEGT